MVVDPRYRNQGLGTLMVRELVDIAYDHGLDSLLFELVEGKEDTAIQVSERMGFARVATLPILLRTWSGIPTIWWILELPLEGWLEW